MNDMTYLLGQETTVLEALLVALREEQEILKGGDADALGPVVDRKNRQFEVLARLGRRRNELLAGLALSPDRAGLVDWGNRARQQDLVMAMLAMSDETQELNRLNGQLIALRLQHTQRALENLNPNQVAQSLYGRSGKTSFAADYRLIDAA